MKTSRGGHFVAKQWCIALRIHAPYTFSRGLRPPELLRYLPDRGADSQNYEEDNGNERRSTR